MKLSVVMAAYDEEATVRRAVLAVRGVPIASLGLTLELIVVDDGSKDGTYGEGEKIDWTDGIAAVWCILRYGLFGGAPTRGAS